MKDTLKVYAVAHKKATQAFYRESLDGLFAAFPAVAWEEDEKAPDVVFFLSGGSEQAAIEKLRPGRFVLLLAGAQGNAFAAAMEVKAWAATRGVPAELLSMQEAGERNRLSTYARLLEGFRTLQGKRAGLIGGVSHWLVASACRPEFLWDRFGIELQHLPWEALGDYAAHVPDPEFLEVFAKKQPKSLDKEAAVYAFLEQLIREHHLDGLTLECFDMVKKQQVTACLALSLLNSKGFPAGCEGDLVSLAGMMLVQAISGHIPWMANVASLNEETVLLAHCTAPLDLLEAYSLNTHFETGESAAICGHIRPDQVTLFRLNENLDKAFVAGGQVVSRPQYEHACRSQIEVGLQPSAIRLLRERPLGNHHLVLPGDQAELLHLACRIRQVDLV